MKKVAVFITEAATFCLFVKEIMTMIAFQPNTRKIGSIFWKVLLAGGLLAFLIYGLSFFFSKPTVETITTHPPKANTANQPMQDVNFQSGAPQKKKH